MSSVCIQFNHDKPNLHLMIIPDKDKITYKEVIRRLKLRWIWRYVIIATSPHQKDILLEKNCEEQTIPPSLKIILYKTGIQPLFFYNKIYYLIQAIEEKNEHYDDVDHTVTWFNYDCTLPEPILIYMIHKENGTWNYLQKTFSSFEEVEAIISKKYFSILEEAKERFEELKEYYM